MRRLSKHVQGHQVFQHWTLGSDLFSSYSLVAQMVKHLSAMQATWIQSLGWEDPLEESMATHSSILA